LRSPVFGASRGGASIYLAFCSANTLFPVMPKFDNASLTSVPDPDDKDVLVIKIQGRTLGWCGDGLAIKRAKHQGVEIGDILDDIRRIAEVSDILDDIEEAESEDDIDEEALKELEEKGLGLSEYVEMVARLLWVGLLRLEPNVPLDAAYALVSVKTLPNLPVAAMVEQIIPDIEEDDTVGKGQEGQNPPR